MKFNYFLWCLKLFIPYNAYQENEAVSKADSLIHFITVVIAYLSITTELW